MPIAVTSFQCDLWCTGGNVETVFEHGDIGQKVREWEAGTLSSIADV